MIQIEMTDKDGRTTTTLRFASDHSAKSFETRAAVNGMITKRVPLTTHELVKKFRARRDGKNF